MTTKPYHRFMTLNADATHSYENAEEGIELRVGWITITDSRIKRCVYYALVHDKLILIPPSFRECNSKGVLTARTPGRRIIDAIKRDELPFLGAIYEHKLMVSQKWNQIILNRMTHFSINYRLRGELRKKYKGSVT